LCFCFFGTAVKKGIRKAIAPYKTEPRFLLELDSKALPQKVSSRKRNVLEYVMDEAVLEVGPECIWLWAAIEVKGKVILGIGISRERNMFVAGRFISGLTKHHDRDTNSTDGDRTWYPQACGLLKIDHPLHSPYEKGIIERTVQYIKDRTECFDDYFPCSRKRGCNLSHVKNWLSLFAAMHNKEILNA
jgi:putative transposase